MNASFHGLAAAFLAASLIGCSSGSQDTSIDPGLSPSVGQGGAQDFGRFRQILEEGGIPGPETIDDVGFFNEHVVSLPSPTCTDDVCLHGTVGMMGNMISGSDCTLLMLGMNTAIDLDTYDRPPLDLAVVVDTSGSMAGTSMDAVKTALHRMIPSLHEEDRLTLIDFDSDATRIADRLSPDDPMLPGLVAALTADGGTNLYDGLRLAYDGLLEVDPTRQRRVVLLSDGLATEGITSSGRIAEMSEVYNAAGIGLSTIGLGDAFDIELMRELAELGGGAFYFLEDPEAVLEVFVEEIEAWVVPLAEEVTIDVDVAEGWDLRGVYGTRLFTMEGNHARITIPTLQVAHRTSPDDIGGGRRGGGGAILLEVLPLPGSAPSEVADVDFRFFTPGTDEEQGHGLSVFGPDILGGFPTGGWFADDGVEKGFVMLNIYVGLHMASERASWGEDTAALAVLEALDTSVTGWLETHEDADIEDDRVWIRRFIENLQLRTTSPMRPEVEPWPQD